LHMGSRCHRVDFPQSQREYNPLWWALGRVPKETKIRYRPVTDAKSHSFAQSSASKLED
jgi:hypothetical protein